ncbi:MAG: hypothetical protein ABJG47_08065 [Ekhidna sp.]
MKTLRIKQLAFIFVLSLIACQEDPLIEKIDPIDEDLEEATLLADEYFNDIGGRANTDERSITILKYIDGQILFNTNTDTISGYQVVTETTITACVVPGEYVFWYRGGGLDDLEGVDFDEDAEAYLNQLPDEYKEDKMWVLKVPDEFDPEHDELKYDIVYESKDNEGVVIRLDPKIQVNNDEESGGEGEGGGDGSAGSTGNEG